MPVSSLTICVRRGRLVRVADRDELLADHAHQHVALGEDALQLLDRRCELLAFLVELLAAELREPAERHVEDVVRLDLGEPERLAPSSASRAGAAVLRRADRLHDRVDHVERLHETFDDVQPRFGLLAAGTGVRRRDDHDLMIEPVLQRLLQRDRARHAVDERHHVHRERRLRGRVLEQVVQHDLRVRVGAQLDDEAGLALPRLVADVADAVDLARDSTSSASLPAIASTLVWNGISVSTIAWPAARGSVFDLVHRAHPHGAAPGAERVLDAVVAHDEAAGREVGALHDAHELRQRDVGLVDQLHRRVAHLGEVVGRDVRGHADRDALRAVHQQVREARRQHDRFGARRVVVRLEVDGALVDARRASPSRAATAGTRCSATRPADRRASRSCRACRSAAR